MRSTAYNIVIIGGGFCGTALAINLLAQPTSRCARILLLERAAAFGHGLAYRDCAHPFLLNVPAERMSMDASDPLQFVRYAQARKPSILPGQYLPRAWYGDYLAQRLRAARAAAAPQLHFESMHGTAQRIQPLRPGGPYLVRACQSDGAQRMVVADALVVASGDPAPIDPDCASRVIGSSTYVRDPFAPGALRTLIDGQCRSVLLLGTGLSMCDVAVALTRQCSTLQLTAISRHGRLPAVQSAHTARTAIVLSPDDMQRELLSGGANVRALARVFRTLLAQADCYGVDWRDVLNGVRPVLPQLWTRLPLAERARFVRHLRVWWDTHRHRQPPPIAACLQRLQTSQRLRVHAGRVQQIEAALPGLQVGWRARGGTVTHSLHVDAVVNCSGSDRRLMRTDDPLWQSLLQQGLAVPDALGLGLRSGPAGQLIGRDGVLVPRLYYLGPMLRADHWEATAVTELRAHAARLAATLLHTAGIRAESTAVAAYGSLA